MATGTYTKEMDYTVKAAALGCWSLAESVSVEQINAMTDIIENIVLPDDVDSYDNQEMAGHIRKHIRKVGNITKSMGRKNELHKLYWASRTRKHTKILRQATKKMGETERDSYVAFAKMTVVMGELRETMTGEQAMALASILLSNDATRLLKAAKAVAELEWEK